MKKEYKLFKFVNHPIVLLARLFVFGVLMLASLFASDMVQKISLYFYALFIANELYIHLKLNNTKPTKTIYQTKDPLECMEWKVRLRLDEKKNIEKYLKALAQHPPQKFLLNRLGISISKFTPVAQDRLIHEALILARRANGTYITEQGIFASYILLQDAHTHLLKNAHVTPDEVAYLLFWTRKKYPPRVERADDIPFAGSGVFDFFVYGWNAELKKYAYDFTLQAIKWGASAHAVGRENEYDLLVKALLKTRNSNVILAGDPGVGKTSLVAFFAKEAFNARVPGHLSKVKVFALQLDRLLAAAGQQGELEKRVSMLLDEISHAGNVIVFIPNIELLFGDHGGIDLSGVLYDYLKSSRIQIIGTTTPAALETVINTHSTHSGLFESIQMREPDEKEAQFMIFESIGHIEHTYHVSFTYRAIQVALKYSSDYQTNLSLPGSAMVLLEDVAAGANTSGIQRISEKEVEQMVQQKTEVLLSEPSQEEKDTLLNLEKVLHNQVVGQEAALSAVGDAMRRLRSGFHDEGKPIASFLFLGPTGVGKTQTAKALASSYFGSPDKMIRLDMSEYSTPESIQKLLGEAPGEEYVDSLIAKVQEHPFTLILLDEFEKADRRVHNMFLQVLDDARLTNNRGETASFENTIIIATSNAGSEYIREHIETSHPKGELMDVLLKNNIFAPELLNRFSEVVIFTPLSPEEMQQIIIFELQKTLQKLQDKDVQLAIDEKALQKIATESYDKQFGARNTQRYLEQNIESLLARLELEGSLQQGGAYTLTLDSTGNFIIQ